MLAQAVTKSKAGLSSLSQTRKLLSASCFFKVFMLDANTLAHLLNDHTCMSVTFTLSSAMIPSSALCKAASSQESGLGGFLFFHKFSVDIEQEFEQ